MRKGKDLDRRQLREDECFVSDSGTYDDQRDDIQNAASTSIDIEYRNTDPTDSCSKPVGTFVSVHIMDHELI